MHVFKLVLPTTHVITYQLRLLQQVVLQISYIQYSGRHL